MNKTVIAFWSEAQHYFSKGYDLSPVVFFIFSEPDEPQIQQFLL
jgi:hypothetical protein